MDIVKRLKAKPPKGFVKAPLMIEAAAEIERLRKQLKQCIWSETEYCKIIEADNARLRKAVDKMTHHLLQFQPSDDFQHDHMVIVKLKSTDIEEIWGFLPQPPKEKNDGQGVS